jgi:hypothetical protein
MNRTSDRDRLLADVLAEAEPAGFREMLLGETLRLAGRRRRARQLRHSATALTVMALVGVVVWRLGSSGHGIVAASATPYSMVKTESLPAQAIIHTQQLEPSCFVTSVASVDVVRTTSNSGQFRIIGDDELLALAAPAPAALVRMGPHSAKLVFANKDDQKYFPLD